MTETPPDPGDPDLEAEADELPELRTLEVHVEDNPVVAVLYDVHGEPLIELTERGTVPFGFQLPGD